MGHELIPADLRHHVKERFRRAVVGSRQRLTRVLVADTGVYRSRPHVL